MTEENLNLVKAICYVVSAFIVPFIAVQMGQHIVNRNAYRRDCRELLSKITADIALLRSIALKLQDSRRRHDGKLPDNVAELFHNELTAMVVSAAASRTGLRLLFADTAQPINTVIKEMFHALVHVEHGKLQKDEFIAQIDSWEGRFLEQVDRLWKQVSSDDFMS